MNKGHEIRIFDFSKAENRDYAPRLTEENGRTIEAYAIVFNQSSRVLYDKSQRKYFNEVIDPRAVTMAFLNDQDIKLNFNHDNDRLLGRSTYGFGSLSYEINDYGVKYKVELPNTTAGNDVLELIKRGDVRSCSFAFEYAKDGVRDEKKDGRNLRTVVKMAAIHDFSIVVDPAYPGAFISSRAFEEPEDAPEVENDGFTAEMQMELDAIDNMTL